MISKSAIVRWAFGLTLFFGWMGVDVPVMGQVTVRLVGDAPDGSRHFIDVDRIEASGPVRRFWRIQNLPQRNQVGALSTRSRYEIQCNDQAIRLLFTVHHQGVQASGPIIITLAEKNSEFQAIAPDSLDQRIYGMVCMG